MSNNETNKTSSNIYGITFIDRVARTANSTLPKVAVKCFVGQFCGYITISASYESLW